MRELILISIHKATCKEDEDEWVDYQTHMNREIRFAEDRSTPHTYTTTKLRWYPDGLEEASLSGWWIDSQAAIDLEERAVS